MSGSLQPPQRSSTTELQDPGAHELDASDDDHFSDASEGDKQSTSPIPTTRVERIDDVPAHGEVPGTAAHSIRTQDAQPDEYEVIPESGPLANNSTNNNTSQNPPIPETVIDKVDPDEPSHGDVEGTLAHDMRKADAAPDVVRKGPEVTRTDLEGLAKADSAGQEDIEKHASPTQNQGTAGATNLHKDDGEIEDDFDAFEEGADAGDDDFGAFDDGDDTVTSSQDTPSAALPSTIAPELSLPIPNFEGLTSVDEIVSVCEPYINELYPGLSNQADNNDLPEISQTFLTERSQSLWEQLVAPPPLQPPDWIRSRVRRLFLVSLGVPVDLDEILPASKQKKLVLPSMEFEAAKRPSRDIRSTEANDRLKSAASDSISRSTSNAKAERKRRGPAPPPDMDTNGARMLCSTTDTALKGLGDDEIRKHIDLLEDMKQRASQLLEYWLIQRDSANGDREAFEEVIENLVKHAKKVRK